MISGVLLEIYEATRIHFVCKENNNNNLFSNSSPRVTSLPYWNVINVINYVVIVFCDHGNILAVYGGTESSQIPSKIFKFVFQR